MVLKKSVNIYFVSAKSFANMAKKMMRSETDIFLVGQPSADIPAAKLHLNREVLKYLLHLKSLPNLKGKPLKEVVSCRQDRGSSDMICRKPGGGGCCDPDGEEGDVKVHCVVYKVKMIWVKAGIPIISDKYIRYIIIKL